jgi:hypothetical protein
MWAVFTLAITGIVGYTYFKEGVFAGFAMLVGTILSGIITFQFWEPLAGLIEGEARGSPLAGFEDALVLVGLFSLSLVLFRLGIQKLTQDYIDYFPMLQQLGGAFFGLLNGYLLSGFLLCVFQTLPWHQNFLGFEPRQTSEAPYRSYLPADRVWLTMMRHAGAYAFSGTAVKNPEPNYSAYDQYETFDRMATFELRYLRYRRYGDNADPLPYFGEFDKALKPSQ